MRPPFIVQKWNIVSFTWMRLPFCERGERDQDHGEVEKLIGADAPSAG